MPPNGLSVFGRVAAAVTVAGAGLAYEARGEEPTEQERHQRYVSLVNDSLCTESHTRIAALLALQREFEISRLQNDAQDIADRIAQEKEVARLIHDVRTTQGEAAYAAASTLHSKWVDHDVYCIRRDAKKALAEYLRKHPGTVFPYPEGTALAKFAKKIEDTEGASSVGDWFNRIDLATEIQPFIQDLNNRSAKQQSRAAQSIYDRIIALQKRMYPLPPEVFELITPSKETDSETAQFLRQIEFSVRRSSSFVSILPPMQGPVEQVLEDIYHYYGVRISFGGSIANAQKEVEINIEKGQTYTDAILQLCTTLNVYPASSPDQEGFVLLPQDEENRRQFTSYGTAFLVKDRPGAPMQNVHIFTDPAFAMVYLKEVQAPESTHLRIATQQSAPWKSDSGGEVGPERDLWHVVGPQPDETAGLEVESWVAPAAQPMSISLADGEFESDDGMHGVAIWSNKQPDGTWDTRVQLVIKGLYEEISWHETRHRTDTMMYAAADATSCVFLVDGKPLDVERSETVTNEKSVTFIYTSDAKPDQAILRTYPGVHKSRINFSDGVPVSFKSIESLFELEEELDRTDRAR